jgi:predicted CoA-substrate-specific enzyme activase
MTAAALGLDLGSTTAKLVAVDAAGALVWHHLEPTDPRAEAQVARFLARAAAELGVPTLDSPAGALPLVATGYGRNLVPRADRKVTEITCHARGVFRALGHGGTLIDIGGQDSKVIVIGPKGNVVGFSMNDKCAAGTGRFLENTAARLRVPLDDMGREALVTTDEVPISSTCTVFAESEIVSLIARGAAVESIVRGLHRSLVQRVVSMVRAAGKQPPILLSGGVARNEAVRAFLSEALGEPVLLPAHPQLMGAYGAALIALG